MDEADATYRSLVWTWEK